MAHSPCWQGMIYVLEELLSIPLNLSNLKRACVLFEEKITSKLFCLRIQELNLKSKYAQH